MKIARIIFILSCFGIAFTVSGQVLPFGFWHNYPNYTFPAGTTTITSANYKNYINKNWIVPGTAAVYISYDQALDIGSLTMSSGAEVTHTACKALPCPRIYLNIHGDAVIPSGAQMDPWGSGYLGGYSATNSSSSGMTTGFTTSGGAQERTGGSHAGYGSYAANATSNLPNAVYDDFMHPFDFGSGGGGSISPTRTGGDGGGAIRLNISGDLTLNGTISADGYDGEVSSLNGAGGGSGGSIWITCRKFTSTSSSVILSAAGGSSDQNGSAGGGGGMIAVYYESLGGTMAFDYNHFSIAGGVGKSNGSGGGSGILYAQQNSATYGDIYFDNEEVNTIYKSTPFPQAANMTYGNITITRNANVTQLFSVINITATKTTVGDNSVLKVPTNSGAGYGVWFVPGTIVLTGSPAGVIVEY